VYENRVLRKIFGPKMKERAGGWRILQNEGLRNLYASLNNIRFTKSRMMKWARHVVCMGEMRHTYKILVGKPEGKSSGGRLKSRWEDNIRRDLRQ
jgi:hypothetical protein